MSASDLTNDSDIEDARSETIDNPTYGGGSMFAGAQRFSVNGGVFNAVAGNHTTVHNVTVNHYATPTATDRGPQRWFSSMLS